MALKQALLNIVRNAMEAITATGNGGELTGSIDVTSENGGRFVRLSISDTGPGIPKEALKQVFEPFYSTKEQGTGLGLAITQQIISEHKGRIKVESEPDRGTTFVITLPAAAESD